MSEVCRKCSYYLYLIGCSHKHLPVSLLKLLMESLISSHIMYALPVWGPPLLNHQVGCLQLIQNRAVRVVFSLKKFDHVSVPHEQLGWPNISEEIEIRSLAAFHHHCFSRQCLQLQPPITFGRSHTYNTRCKAYFANSTYHHLARTQQSFRHRTTCWWNKLPFEVPHKHGEFVTLTKTHRMTNNS